MIEFRLTPEEINQANKKHDLISKIDKKLHLKDRTYGGNTTMGYRAEKAFEKFCDAEICTQISKTKEKIFGHSDYICKTRQHKGEMIELKANGDYALKQGVFKFNVQRGYVRARQNNVTILIALIEKKLGVFVSVGWLPITEEIPKKYLTFETGNRKAYIIPFTDFKPLEEVALLREK